jgi:hypothetical protein
MAPLWRTTQTLPGFMFLKSVISFLVKGVNAILLIPKSKVRPSAKIFAKSQTHMSVTCRSLVLNSIQTE